MVLIVLDEALRSLQGRNMSHISILNEAAVAGLAELGLVQVILVRVGHFRRELILLTKYLRGTRRETKRLVTCLWKHILGVCRSLWRLDWRRERLLVEVGVRVMGNGVHALALNYTLILNRQALSAALLAHEPATEVSSLAYGRVVVGGSDLAPLLCQLLMVTGILTQMVPQGRFEMRGRND